MKIYTKTGDTGDTSLFGGKRVPKSSLRIEAYGTVDELNAQLGVVRSQKPSAETDKILEQLQNQLFILGADLAAPDLVKLKGQRIQQSHIDKLEKYIDQLDEKLESLNLFVLPGGGGAGAHLHVARTICRRAERRVDALGRIEDLGKAPLIYLNRLADLLFVLARYENKVSEVGDTKWNERKER